MDYIIINLEVFGMLSMFMDNMVVSDMKSNLIIILVENGE